MTGTEEAVTEVRRWLNAHPGEDYLSAACEVAQRIGDRPPERIGHEGWHEFICAVRKEFAGNASRT